MADTERNRAGGGSPEPPEPPGELNRMLCEVGPGVMNSAGTAVAFLKDALTTCPSERITEPLAARGLATLVRLETSRQIDVRELAGGIAAFDAAIQLEWLADASATSSAKERAANYASALKELVGWLRRYRD